MMKLRDALFCPELAGIFGLCEAREQAGRQLAPTNDLRFAGVVAVNGPVLYGKMAKGTSGDRTARGCESSNCRRGCPGGHIGPRRRRAARLDAKDCRTSRFRDSGSPSIRKSASAFRDSLPERPCAQGT